MASAPGLALSLPGCECAVRTVRRADGLAGGGARAGPRRATEPVRSAQFFAKMACVASPPVVRLRSRLYAPRLQLASLFTPAARSRMLIAQRAPRTPHHGALRIASHDASRHLLTQHLLVLAQRGTCSEFCWCVRAARGRAGARTAESYMGYSACFLHNHLHRLARGKQK